MSFERDALLREVHEELRRERLQKIWDQYGTYLLIAAVALLFGVAGYKWWEVRAAGEAQNAGARFEQALDLTAAGNTAEAQKILQTVGAGSAPGYAALAQLTLAGQAAKAGNTDAAIAAYETASKQAPDELMRDYARLQIASLKIDSADFTEVQNRLNDLIGDKSPWRYMARELLGVAAIRAGKLDEARNVLAPLSVDPRASAAVRERAGAMMAIVVAAELARSAPSTVEREKTEEPAAAPGGAPSAQVAPASPEKVEMPRPKAPPSKGSAKGK